MLDRLERADGPAELLPLAGVAHAHIEHLLRNAELLRRARQRGAIERRGEQPLRRLARGDAGRGARRPLDTEQAARRIAARLAHQRRLLARHRVQLGRVRQQQQVGDVRIGDERIDRVTDGEDRLARRDLRQPRVGEGAARARAATGRRRPPSRAPARAARRARSPRARGRCRSRSCRARRGPRARAGRARRARRVAPTARWSARSRCPTRRGPRPPCTPSRAPCAGWPGSAVALR